MSSLLPKNALEDFLEISRPFCGVSSDDPTSDYKEIHEAIRKTLEWSGNGLHFEAVHNLWKILEIAVHLKIAEPIQWQLLAIVREALYQTPKCAPLYEKEVWHRALQLAARLHHGRQSVFNILENTREAVVAKSLCFLRDNGYRIEIDGRGALLKEKDYDSLCAKIEKHISFFGGLNFIKVLLSAMRDVGRIVDGSFISARIPAHPDQPAWAESPFHFLYNLALKNIQYSGRGGNRSKDFEKAKAFARHLAAALDVQPHSIYANMSLPSVYFEKPLTETVIYDELFGFPQWQPRVSAKLFQWWVRALAETGCDFPHATETQWAEFGVKLHAFAREDSLTHLTVFHFAPLTLELPVATKLMEACSVGTRHLNRGYRTPKDSDKRMNGAFPLIRKGDDAYILQPKALVVRALCERLAELMREDIRATSNEPKKALSVLDTKHGRALELLTISVLKDIGANVTVDGGKYRGRSKSDRLEIDVVVETDERIFLFECKKKVLTAEARGKGGLALFTDLTNSFLKMQAQLARHEAKLRRDGKIEFIDGKVLELKGRPVEKFAISLFDHGALQDRAMIVPLFERILGMNVRADDPRADGVMAAMNKELNVLNESLTTISNAQPGLTQDQVDHDYAMSSWWLSVDQLYYLCAEKGLWEGLLKLRHLTARSGDIIWEAHRVENLNSVGRALLEATQKMNNRAII